MIKLSRNGPFYYLFEMLPRFRHGRIIARVTGLQPSNLLFAMS